MRFDPSPPSPGREVSAPKVAGPWKPAENMGPDDIERDCLGDPEDCAALVCRSYVGGEVWVFTAGDADGTNDTGNRSTREEAQAAADAILVAEGWALE